MHAGFKLNHCNISAFTHNHTIGYDSNKPRLSLDLKDAQTHALSGSERHEKLRKTTSVEVGRDRPGSILARRNGDKSSMVEDIHPFPQAVIMPDKAGHRPLLFAVAPKLDKTV
jgi:hypothetical protein